MKTKTPYVIALNCGLLFGFSPLTFPQDTRKADFPGKGRSNAIGFSIGQKGYVGTGHDSVQYHNDFWEYDQQTDTWARKADFPGVGRARAVAFVIGNKAYVGTGSFYSNDFWEYDPSTDIWTRKADFPGGFRIEAVGFSIGAKGYIGTGIDTGGVLSDFWEYDQQTNTWTRKADFPGGTRGGAAAFAIGNKGYAGTGHNLITYFGDFWEYDPLTDTWTRKADLSPRYYAIAFTVGNKGYVGTGFHYSEVGAFWVYDTSSNVWALHSVLTDKERIRATAFSIGDYGYFGTGNAGSVYLNDFWEYNPNALRLPNQVELAYPLDGDSVEVDFTERKVHLLWSESLPSVTNYRVDISLDSLFGGGTFSDTTIVGTSYLWKVPQTNRKYWWRVKGKNKTGWGPYSEARSFIPFQGESNRIDIMVVYTPAAEAWANQNVGGIDLVIAHAMIIGQDAISNSDVKTSIHLAYSGLVDYVESGVSSTDLNRLSSPNDGYMDQIHEWRSSYKADLVVLLGMSSDFGGYAYILTSSKGNANSGFSVTYVGLARSFAFIHEIGHNMGNNHSRNQLSFPAPPRPQGGLFEYSTGWRWTGTDGKSYADVMTYPEESIWVPVFSNPNILWAGTPTGSYDTTNVYAPADNARSMNEISHVIAGYRRPESPVLNVATSSLTFGDVAISDSSFAIGIVSAGSGLLVEIDSLRVSLSEYSVVADVPVALAPGDTMKFSVVFKPREFGMFVDTLRIYNNSQTRVLMMPLSGNSPTPSISMTPESISFETVEKDSTSQKLFRITNSSVNALRIDSVWTKTPHFEVTNTLTNSIIHKSDTVVGTIRFTPDSARIFADTLYIANKSPVSPAKIPLFGNGIITGVATVGSEIPLAYIMYQNYPNPFNPLTKIRFGVPVRSGVLVRVYNILGQIVIELVNEEVNEGYFESTWNAKVASGLYFYRIEAISVDDPSRKFVDVKKMILLR